MFQLNSGQALQIAQQYHQSGRLPEAESLYRQIISNEPNHAIALHQLGILECQAQHYKSGAELISRAVAVNPNWPEACCNLGTALTYCGRLDEAIVWCQKAIALKPNFAEAHNSLGNVLYKKKSEQSIAAFRRAIELKPDFAEACQNLGQALLANGKLQEAIATLRHTTELNPKWPEAFGALGAALDKAGAEEAAKEALRQALQLNPDMSNIRFILAALSGDTSVRTIPSSMIRDLFDDYARNFDEHLLRQLKYRVPEYLLQAVVTAAPGREFDVFDLGCGTGLCGMQFRPHATRLTGVDLAPLMIEACKNRHIYDELITGSLVDALRDRPLSCDLLVAGDVFNYIGDLSELFPVAAAALRPTGLLAFSVERHEGDNFTFLPKKRRFAHSLAYIRNIAHYHGLRGVTVREVVLRKELQHDALGWIIVLQKH